MVVDTHQRRLKLLSRITARWPVVTDQMTLGPLRLDFTRVADPNRVLDEIADEEDRRERKTGVRKPEDQLHLPYWAELWESSIAIASFVAAQWAACGRDDSHIARLAKQTLLALSSPTSERSQSARAARVMDLGCGMGLAGVAAARLGANVLFADLESPALLFAQLNSLGQPGRCRARKVNWQTDRLNEQFDLILGADIVYDRSQWQYLAPFFNAHLAPAGTVLLGEPGRSSGEEFVPWIAAQGWQVQRHQQPLPGSPQPIHLLELLRAPAPPTSP